MATTCESIITQGLDKNCQDPLVRGFERKGWIFNRRDIDFSAVEFGSLPNVLSTLPLKEGAKGYSIYQYGSTPYTGSSVVLSPGIYGASATNNLNIVVMDASPEVHANFIDPAMDGDFVVVLEAKYKNLNAASNAGASAFRVFGFYQGLTLAESTSEFYSDDSMGGFPLSLTEANVPKSALFLYATSYEATKQMLDDTLV